MVDDCAIFSFTVVINTSCSNHFITWKVVDLVWNPVSNRWDTYSVEWFKSCFQVSQWTVLVVLTHTNIITVCKGITILDDWVKEATVITWNVLWCKFKWCDTPWFEEIGVFSNLLVSVLWWVLDEVLEVRETFVDNLWIKGSIWFVDQTTAVFLFTWCYTHILSFRGSYWHPNSKVTINLRITDTTDFVCIKCQITITISVFDNAVSIAIIQVSSHTIVCCQKQWTISLVTVSRTHVNCQVAC